MWACADPCKIRLSHGVPSVCDSRSILSGVSTACAPPETAVFPTGVHSQTGAGLGYLPVIAKPGKRQRYRGKSFLGENLTTSGAFAFLAACSESTDRERTAGLFSG